MSQSRSAGERRSHGRFLRWYGALAGVESTSREHILDRLGMADLLVPERQELPAEPYRAVLLKTKDMVESLGMLGDE
jgi:hypothetical protein